MVATKYKAGQKAEGMSRTGRHVRGARGWREIPPEVRPIPNLATVRAVAKGRLEPGVVVWAHVPFIDVDSEKTRPAVVKMVSGRDVTIFPTSAAVSRHRFPDRYTELRDLRDAGLWRPTGVRRREITIDRIDVISVVGHLSEVDMAAVIGSTLTRANLEGSDAA